jgi:hypothetical protein
VYSFVGSHEQFTEAGMDDGSNHSDVKNDDDSPASHESIDYPCFLCMDSLKIHNMSEICRTLRV